MNRISVVIKTLVSRVLLLCIILLYSIPFSITLLIPTKWLYRIPLFYWMTYSFYWFVLKCSFLNVTFEGIENIPEEPAVFVANHQSSLDIPLIGYLLKGAPQIWLAATSLKKFFLYRIALPKFVVWVNMVNSHTGMRSLVQVIRIIHKTKQHIIIFPEGARFTDGSIHNFFAGFAILARKTGRPVVPVRLFGLNEVYPPNSFWVYCYPVRVVIGKPMHRNEDESDQEFRTRVRSWFLEQGSMEE